MRLDKFLKVSRIIKRRTVANEVCDQGRVLLNGRLAKAGASLKEGDCVEIAFGTGPVRFEVLKLVQAPRKEEASELYRLLD